MEKFCKKKKKNSISMFNTKKYKISFELFLKKTNEKAIVEKFIKEHVSLHKEMNFLDIGGGDGSLAGSISKEVGSTLVIEPNEEFCNLLKQKKVNVINLKWESVELNYTYDFILAAYVVTYFPKNMRSELIKKIYNHLRRGGTALILSVDSKKGSWRRIHTYFYTLIGHDHFSSDSDLKKITKFYKPHIKTFKTSVIAQDADEMLEILSFDFHKYPKEFLRYSDNLKLFLKKYTNKKGKVRLEMVHNAYIINKP